MFGVGEDVGGVEDGGEGARGQITCCFALRGREGVFGGVVGGELCADVGVDGGELFLEGCDELGDGLVLTVFDAVPGEGLDVLVYGFCGSMSVWVCACCSYGCCARLQTVCMLSPGLQGVGEHTIVDVSLLSCSFLVALE